MPVDWFSIMVRPAGSSILKKISFIPQKVSRHPDISLLDKGLWTDKQRRFFSTSRSLEGLTPPSVKSKSAKILTKSVRLWYCRLPRTYICQIYEMLEKSSARRSAKNHRALRVCILMTNWPETVCGKIKQLVFPDNINIIKRNNLYSWTTYHVKVHKCNTYFLVRSLFSEISCITRRVGKTDSDYFALGWVK